MVMFYQCDAMLAWVLAMAMCLSVYVRLSVTSRVLLKWMNGLIWFLAWGFLSTSPTLCFEEIQVSPSSN